MFIYAPHMFRVTRACWEMNALVFCLKHVLYVCTHIYKDNSEHDTPMEAIFFQSLRSLADVPFVFLIEQSCGAVCSRQQPGLRNLVCWRPLQGRSQSIAPVLTRKTVTPKEVLLHLFWVQCH